MSAILEAIELRLYRWEQDVARGCDRVGAAQQMAIEILNLTKTQAPAPIRTQSLVDGKWVDDQKPPAACEHDCGTYWHKQIDAHIEHNSTKGLFPKCPYCPESKVRFDGTQHFATPLTESNAAPECEHDWLLHKNEGDVKSFYCRKCAKWQHQVVPLIEKPKSGNPEWIGNEVAIREILFQHGKWVSMKQNGLDLGRITVCEKITQDTAKIMELFK